MAFNPQYTSVADRRQARREAKNRSERENFARTTESMRQRLLQTQIDKAVEQKQKEERLSQATEALGTLDTIAAATDAYRVTGDESHIKQLMGELTQQDNPQQLLQMAGGLAKGDKATMIMFDDLYGKTAKAAGRDMGEPSWVEALDKETGDVVYADKNSRFFDDLYSPKPGAPKKIDYVEAQLDDGTAARVSAGDPRITRILTNEEKKALGEMGGFEAFGSDDYLKRVRGEVGNKKKKASQAENEAAGYYSRMVQSEQDIRRLLEAVPEFDPSSAVEASRGVTNVTASEEYQLYKQASMNWIRANLRKESGAVIAKEEAAEEFENYFPVYGDSDIVIKQKAATRKRLAESMKVAAGVAEIPSIGDPEWGSTFDKWAETKQPKDDFEGWSIVP